MSLIHNLFPLICIHICTLYCYRQWCKEEVGVNARHSIACLSAVIPHCLYSSEYLHCLTHMDLNVSDYHNLSILKQKENDEDKISTNLYLIKSIVIIIKKLVIILL